jgi:hypothetical protein
MKGFTKHKIALLLIFVLTLGVTYLTHATQNTEISTSQRAVADHSSDRTQDLNSTTAENSSSNFTDHEWEDSLPQDGNENPSKFVPGSIGSMSVNDHNLYEIFPFENVYQRLHFILKSNTLESFIEAFIWTLFVLFAMMLSWFFSSTMGMAIGSYRGMGRFQFKIKNSSSLHPNQRISLKARLKATLSQWTSSHKTKPVVSYDPPLITEDPVLVDEPATEEPVVEAPVAVAPVVEDPPMDSPTFNEPVVDEEPHKNHASYFYSSTTTTLNLSAKLNAIITLGSLSTNDEEEITSNLENEDPTIPSVDDENSTDPNQPVEEKDNEVVVEPEPEVNEETPSSPSQPNNPGSPVITPENDSPQNVAAQNPTPQDFDKEDLNTPTMQGEGNKAPSDTIDESLPPTALIEPEVGESLRDDLNDPTDIPSDLPVNPINNPAVDPDSTLPSTTSSPSSPNPVLLVSLDASANMEVVTNHVTNSTTTPGYENSKDYQNYESQPFDPLKSENQTPEGIEMGEEDPNSLNNIQESIENNLLARSPFVPSISQETSGRRLGGEVPKGMPEEPIKSTPIESSPQVIEEPTKKIILENKMSSRFSFFARIRVFGSWLGSNLNWIIQNIFALLLLFITSVGSIFNLFFDRNKNRKKQQDW